ncbi:MAG: DMT family transporter [Alphaproteobacteria bacterium]|nr:DMT family transporter [Alphaproteobacteria bacterium]
MSYEAPKSWTRLPPAVEGVLWMCFAAAAWTANNVLIRPISQAIPPVELQFFRSVFSVVLLLPYFMLTGWGQLRTRKTGILLARGVVMFFSMISWIYAVKLMPIADAVAIGFTAPLFATLLAIVFLGEKVGPRRWTAIAIGFLGSLVIVRPGFATIEAGAIFAFANAASWSAAIIIGRFLTRSVPPTVVVFYMFACLTVFAGIPTYFVWETPSWDVIGLLVALATTGLLGHLAATRAFAMAETSLIAPVEYVSLPMSGIAAYFLFFEVPHPMMPVGAAIIIASVLYISHREAVRARQAAQPAPPKVPKDT